MNFVVPFLKSEGVVYKKHWQASSHTSFVSLHPAPTDRENFFNFSVKREIRSWLWGEKNTTASVGFPLVLPNFFSVSSFATGP